MLIAMAVNVSTDGISRVNPSVYLRPIAQPTSINPAASNKNQAIGPSQIMRQGRPAVVV